MAFYFMRITLL